MEKVVGVDSGLLSGDSGWALSDICSSETGLASVTVTTQKGSELQRRGLLQPILSEVVRDLLGLMQWEHVAEKNQLSHSQEGKLGDQGLRMPFENTPQ